MTDRQILIRYCKQCMDYIFDQWLDNWPDELVDIACSIQPSPWRSKYWDRYETQIEQLAEDSLDEPIEAEDLSLGGIRDLMFDVAGERTGISLESICNPYNIHHHCHHNTHSGGATWIRSMKLLGAA